MAKSELGRISYITTDHAKTQGWLHDNLITFVHEYQFASDGVLIHYGWFRPINGNARKAFIDANPEAEVLPHILSQAQLPAAIVTALQTTGVVAGDGPYVAYSKIFDYLKKQGCHNPHLNPEIW